MIEFKTSKGEFVAVELESDKRLYELQDMFGYGLEGISTWFKLSEITEENAKLIVTTHESESINTHLMKLNYILKAKGIDVDNGNWYLFKKI